MGSLRNSIKVALTATAVAGLGTSGFAYLRWMQRRTTEAQIMLSEKLPVHSAWWQDRAKKAGEIFYVAIGDSAAQGIGASKPWRSYVGLLALRIRKMTGKAVRVRNLSVSGATVALAVQDQLPAFRSLTPDIVTVSIGANDIADFNPTVFEAGLREIFSALPSQALVADLPCFYLPRAEKKVAIANHILRRVAAEHGLTVVPLHQRMKRQGVFGILTQFAPDLFHPNDRGYAIWASAFEPYLTGHIRDQFPVDATGDTTD